MTASTQQETTSGLFAFLAPFKTRNFRLLWIGEAISLTGDQFYFIALPWLVLQLTHSALAVGTVLAVSGVPRAVFMLVGGALTDRFSPRKLMFYSNIIRMGLVTLLAILLFANQINLFWVYVFAFFFGVADAFFYPAQNAIVPQLVEDEYLEQANAIVSVTSYLTIFAAPVFAGLLIANFSTEVVAAENGVEEIPQLTGLAWAFLIDGLTFIASAMTLWRIKTMNPPEQAEEGLWSSIRGVLVQVWKDPILRIFYSLVGGVAFLVLGPIQVGIPVLSDSRFVGGAVAFGTVLSAYGGGALLGSILGGILSAPRPRWLGYVLLAVTSLLGFSLISLAFIQTALIAAVVMAIIGTCFGYITVLGITWLQRRTPQEELGRMMSLLVLASVGLFPISLALAGFFIELSTEGLFVGAGAMILIITLASVFHPAVPRMGIIKD
ncbi:MAG: MFS transporter [Chloroflexi bacterium]|nr:MAG: MFS transporter [Chloroflexota bacterium]MBL1194924.1 MFS transporter [Chloroflexota bacterium]NOH12215.1 MFS transporter [Chloroflexota bacterium]